MVTALENSSVKRVQAALALAGSAAQVIELTETARTAEAAAASVGCPLGAIVKSLVFLIQSRPVVALVAGDRRCDMAALPAALGLSGKARRAEPETVRAATGFAIGGVAPVGYPGPLPAAIDASLRRFETVYAAAGHPHCVFATTVDELVRVTGGVLSEHIAQP